MLNEGRRIVKARDFNRVYRFGKKVKGGTLNLYFIANKSGVTRFGFSISKKVGKAVKRNLLKRRLREICRKHINSFLPGVDVVIVARKEAVQQSFADLEQEVLNLGRMGKIL
ncbi:Ribonuclease P protein component [Moorella humiferrea]|uniref:Ribonuclease P protein component n=1 Tax=Neomoorella humiferrea TaxID=676965 RepID=A0A2T0AS83_9FIRM|nr:ribonuclease P protein component [Moorella humiferrea]PRR72926.1 Ribonuclease P protein component [Moorella humiferrea]